MYEQRSALFEEMTLCAGAALTYFLETAIEGNRGKVRDDDSI